MSRMRILTTLHRALRSSHSDWIKLCVGSLVLVSGKAFGHDWPGIPDRLLCLNASLPGGTVVTVQLLSGWTAPERQHPRTWVKFAGPGGAINGPADL